MSTLGSITDRHLTYEETYPCPVCRYGEIAPLTLMDAFACNFCRHILTANLSTQAVQLADSSQLMAWRWNGKTWQPMHHAQNANLTGVVWFIGLVLVIMPAALVGLASYIFPGTDPPAWSFPIAWTTLTFLVHAVLVGWLLAEHHQFPLYVTLKVRFQGFLTPRS